MLQIDTGEHRRVTSSRSDLKRQPGMTRRRAPGLPVIPGRLLTCQYAAVSFLPTARSLQSKAFLRQALRRPQESAVQEIPVAPGFKAAAEKETIAAAAVRRFLGERADSTQPTPHRQRHEQGGGDATQPTHLRLLLEATDFPKPRPTLDFPPVSHIQTETKSHPATPNVSSCHAPASTSCRSRNIPVQLR